MGFLGIAVSGHLSSFTYVLSKILGGVRLFSGKAPICPCVFGPSCSSYDEAWHRFALGAKKNKVGINYELHSFLCTHSAIWYILRPHHARALVVGTSVMLARVHFYYYLYAVSFLVPM